jgi:hypothetical protein
MKIIQLAIILILPFIASANDTLKVDSIFRFNKGSHFSSPRGLFKRMIYEPNKLVWECRFDKSCCYQMCLDNGQLHEDQWDYNKLLGITFTPLNPHNNTAMVGWRHHPDSLYFELIPYWHIHKKRVYKERPCLTVKPDEKFKVEIMVDYIKYTITTSIITSKGKLEETQYYKGFSHQAALIYPYFGGTSRAPNDMFLFCLRTITY